MNEDQTATVVVDGEKITGTVYHVRDNGWLCVVTESGRVASGPEVVCATVDTVKQHEVARALHEALVADPLVGSTLAGALYGSAVIDYWPKEKASHLGWAEAPVIVWEGGPFEWAVALTGTEGKSLDSEYRPGSMETSGAVRAAFAAVREAGFYCECVTSWMLAVYPS